eukprot:2884434-Rhodomonas_salina.1
MWVRVGGDGPASARSSVRAASSRSAPPRADELPSQRPPGRLVSRRPVPGQYCAPAPLASAPARLFVPWRALGVCVQLY